MIKAPNPKTKSSWAKLISRWNGTWRCFYDTDYKRLKNDLRKAEHDIERLTHELILFDRTRSLLKGAKSYCGKPYRVEGTGQYSEIAAVANNSRTAVVYQMVNRPSGTYGVMLRESGAAERTVLQKRHTDAHELAKLWVTHQHIRSGLMAHGVLITRAS